jgi:hypothetical protein
MEFHNQQNKKIGTSHNNSKRVLSSLLIIEYSNSLNRNKQVNLIYRFFLLKKLFKKFSFKKKEKLEKYLFFITEIFSLVFVWVE